MVETVKPCRLESHYNHLLFQESSDTPFPGLEETHIARGFRVLAMIFNCFIAWCWSGPASLWDGNLAISVWSD